MRLCKTAKRLGIPTVAIYVAADAGSSHIKAADEFVEVPSYLDEEAIVAAALKTKATAVIPGYGFISESRVPGSVPILSGISSFPHSDIDTMQPFYGDFSFFN